MKKLLITLLVSLLMLSGCSETKETLTGSAKGYNGDVKVEVVKESDKIVSVKVVEHSETEGIGTLAIESLPQAIIDANSTEVDLVAGASFTSQAIIEAVNQANGVKKEVVAEKTDGKFVTKAHGQESYVHVATHIFDGEIKKVEVLGHHETIGIGTYAIDEIPTAIVENQSIEVDAVSGATLTSFAIKNAVKEAIEMAGLNVDDFSTKVNKEVVLQEVPSDVDVVIVGAGTAGLVAANRLLEAGKSVVVFEKQDIPGGAMSTTYSGVLSYNSEISKKYTGNTEAQEAEKLAGAKAYWESKVVPENDLEPGFQYWNQVTDNSGQFVDWLHDIGVGFSTMNDHIGSTPFLAPGAYQGGVGYAMEYLVKRVTDLGGQIVYSTPVTSLVQDDAGNITGVVANDGVNEYKINSKKTLLATGGFGNNKEMLKEYYPQYAQYRFNTTAGSDGDGIQMGLAVGAGVDSMGRTLGAFMSTYDTKYELAFMHYSTPGIIVNVNGDSIGNIISGNHSVLSREKVNEVNEDTFYYVIDEAARRSTVKSNYNGLSFGVSYEPIFETGQAVHYESLEAAAKELNLPGLVAAVEENNGYALSGEPTKDGRKNSPYIDDQDGIYILRVDPTFYVTTGGLSANVQGQIITPENTVIGNLYGAGDVLGSLEEKDGLKYGYGFDSAMIFGYVVAENIVNSLN